MIQNNNFSVLPFYDILEQQHRNKPYAFGSIYPLITPADTLLPFQITREHREEVIEDVDLREEYTYRRYSGYYLSKNGPQEAQSGFDVIRFIFTSAGISSVYISVNNANRVYADAIIAMAEDSDGNATFLEASEDYTGTWVLPKNIKYLYVQIKATGYEGELLGTIKNIQPIISVNLYNCEGEFVQDITQQMLDCGLSAVASENHKHDIIIFPAQRSLHLELQTGTYYIQMRDDVQTWYSEMFSVVKDIESYLKIEWWDDENLVFDSGEIIYDVSDYKNTIYLDTDIGKPSYNFEEDGKERDGYFFAAKQLSEKVYRFTFVAPEFVCDAIRFIRLSDNIEITKNNIKYKPDSFLIDVDWQAQGDLAAVEVEFKTNTVVKKIAAAWPK